MKNIETPDKIHLGRLIEELRSGKYVIPDFQREFEWRPQDVIDLLKSIFEDYYIGTLLFWRASKENQDLLKCEPIYGFEGKPSPEHIILDGQQRLSALYYVLFAPNKPYPRRKSKCFFFIKLEEILRGNFDEAFYYEWVSKKTLDFAEDRNKQFGDKIFPLFILGPKPYTWVKWLEGYQKYWASKIGDKKAETERKKVEKILEELISTYYISYIELDRNMEIFKVCDIFTRINSTGMELTIFDLLNAVLRPKDIYLKEMWRRVSSNLDIVEAEKMRIYLLQTMSILKQRYCAPKYLYYLVPDTKKTIKAPDGSKKKIVLIDSKEEFVNLWKFVVERVKKTIEILKNPRDFGAIKPEFIPYPSMTPILTALNIEKETEAYTDKQDIEHKIRRWYWSSIFTKNYSSAVESQMTKDFDELQEWFKDDTRIPSVIVQFDPSYLDLKSETSKSSAIYKAIFDILILKGAKDWDTFVLPEYSNLEDHHIVPRSWGEKRVGKDINSILNRTPISDKTNKEIIRNQLPNIYLKRMFDKAKDKEEVYRLLETHLISREAVEILLKKDFSEKNYEEFLKEREKTILNEIRQLLGTDIKQQIDLITPETPFSNKLQIEQIIKSCSGHLYWVDKYFSKAGLEIINQALFMPPKPKLNEIRILSSIDKADSNLRKSFKDFKKELENKNIKVDLRIIISNKIKSEIHDRWIMTRGKAYNLPSPDVIFRGQYSEIKETKNIPPFKQWWAEGLDIITEWNKIEDAKTGKN